MSKQANEVRKILDILYDDYAEEVDLSKITNIKMHKGIRVDFYVPDINCIVEIHGQQHESAQSFGNNKIAALNQLNRQLDRDSKLRSICDKFKINYIEVWHNEKVTLDLIYKKLSCFADEEESND